MPVTTSSYANNETIIYSYLKNEGYNTAFICGVLANIEQESSFNPQTYNSREGAYGLCQWRGGRKTSLESFCRKNGYSVSSVKGQIAFMLYELSTSESKAKGKITGLPNTAQGASTVAYNFCEYYERAADIHNQQRANLSVKYWNYYTGSNVNISIADGIKLSEVNGNGGNIINPNTRVEYQESVRRESLSAFIADNLSKVEASGYDYGYLIALDHEGSFKFYLPPSFTESAGASWDSVNIPGRSVDIKAYSRTSSRSITISVDLYADVGLYAGVSDPVGAIHRDANFVKSLEYPDYSSAIVEPPTRVHLILGSAVSMKGVVSGVQVTHMKPVDSQNRAMYLKVNFTVTQVADNPPDYSDIAKGQYTITTGGNISTLP